MKDYFREDITISIDFSEHEEVLKEQLGENLSLSTYDSSLIYNQRKPDFLQLTIYYPHTDYLFEKLRTLKENGICILNILKPKQVDNKWEFPEILDFSESKLISIEESHYWEQNKKPVVLTIDNINILVNGRYVDYGRLQLTENIFHHLVEYIQYGLLGSHDYVDKFIEKDNNRETNFGPIRFILSFEHWFDDSTKFNLNISRDAYLTIKDSSESLTDIELLELGSSLCLLMSFYWQKTIDFFIAHVRINNISNYGTRKYLKYSNHFVDESDDFILKGKFETFYDFIDFINYERFNENLILFKEIVPRIIRTKYIDDISAFMIHYNIIEKIRNYCMSVPVMGTSYNINEEFKFIRGKTATNKFIKKKIQEISQIVDLSDIKKFLNKASDKVNFIKKTGLIDQFDSLLIYLKLNPDDYNIDFISLVRIRNNIYHGKLPKEDVKPYNEQMILLIYDMLLRLLTN